MSDTLDARRLSAVELLEAHLRRRERLDPQFNSIIALDLPAARRDAARADEARARGIRGPLLGIPITVKESIDVQGTASTAGVTWRSTHRAATDARAVQRLRAAGAVILGKTNVCPYLADFIADNPVYGRTSNPWDRSRTPGGSSGGSAAVAAGLCGLDLGSDLGGSIRIPAAFCGLWGHKPSEGLVPNSGHFPGSPLPNLARVMAAQGPLARSAGDLEVALDLLASPDAGMEVGWTVRVPPARHTKLSSFRIAVLPWQDWLPVDSETISAIENLADRLRSVGATVSVLSIPGIESLRDFHAVCRSMMSALVSTHWSSEQRQGAIDDKLARGEFSHLADAKGFAASASDYLKWHDQRELYRQAYRQFFADWDILLTPTSLVPAFPHPALPVVDRILDIDGRMVGFDYLSFYPGVASLVGHGATAFPIGLTRSGLPLGAQAIGPFLEDRTPLRFAQLMEQEFGGFIAPPLLDAELS